MKSSFVLSLTHSLFSLLAAVTLSDAAEPEKLPYPGDVALLQEPTGLVYRHFPTGLRLYVYDRDSEGRSACNAGCSSAWPPVVPHTGATPLGDWTIIVRDDGRQQWAYKGRPVYVLYHDSPSAPQGDGVDRVWHFLQP